MLAQLEALSLCSGLVNHMVGVPPADNDAVRDGTRPSVRAEVMPSEPAGGKSVLSSEQASAAARSVVAICVSGRAGCGAAEGARPGVQREGRPEDQRQVDAKENILPTKPRPGEWREGDT